LSTDRKACGIFFDILKTFHKVWHKGLIKMKVPGYILKFITLGFLKDRKFRVSIGNTLSKSCDILCSVPQDPVLGLILFLVLSNDIPLADSKHTFSNG